MTDPATPCCPAPQPGPGKRRCPGCGQPGGSVPAETLQHLLRPEAIPDHDDGFFFCATPSCSVVYFRPDGTVLDKGAVRIRIGVKEHTDPVSVCYCFAITRADIAAEIREHGLSTASQRIETMMQERGCDCRRRNPSGRCCLATVRATEKQLAEKRC